MTLRTAGPVDARAVAALLHDFNEEFDEPTPGPEVLTRRLEAMLARDDVEALVIGDPPAGVGLMTFRPGVWDEGPVCLLEELYVRPELRGRGLGGQLLERAFEIARAHGSRTFEINVDEEDADAQRFYEAHGVHAIEPGGSHRSFYLSREL